MNNQTETKQTNYSIFAAAVFWTFLFVVLNALIAEFNLNTLISETLSASFSESTINFEFATKAMTFLFTVYFSVTGFLNAKSMLIK